MNRDEIESRKGTGKYSDERTTFNTQGHGRQFKRMAEQNTGRLSLGKEDYSKFVVRDRLATFDALASQAELTGYQKQRGRRAAERIDCKPGHYKIETVVFSICAVVASFDGRDPFDTKFSEVLDSLNVSNMRFENCLEYIRPRVEDIVA